MNSRNGHWRHMAYHFMSTMGEPLAEALSDRDVFWIAAEFLEYLPKSIRKVPKRIGTKQSLEKWKKLEPRASSMADFIEIKDGIRRSTFVPECRKDLDGGSPKCRLLSRRRTAGCLRRQPTRSPSQHSVVEDRCGSRRSIETQFFTYPSDLLAQQNLKIPSCCSAIASRHLRKAKLALPRKS